MPAYARQEIVATAPMGVYHGVARCVRRAFLCVKRLVDRRPSNRKSAGKLTPTAALAGEAPDGWLCELTLDDGPSARANDIGTSPHAEPLPAQPRQINTPRRTGSTPPHRSNPGSQSATHPGETAAAIGRRASNKGFLPLQTDKYRKLLDWTGRSVRSDKRGAIPSELAPILERLQVNGDNWVETVRNFGVWFKRAAGRAVSLADAAAGNGRQWFQGLAHAQSAFT